LIECRALLIACRALLIECRALLIESRSLLLECRALLSVSLSVYRMCTLSLSLFPSLYPSLPLPIPLCIPATEELNLPPTLAHFVSHKPTNTSTHIPPTHRPEQKYAFFPQIQKPLSLQTPGVSSFEREGRGDR